MPTHFHAIVWIDHSQARIFHLGLTGDDEITCIRISPLGTFITRPTRSAAATPHPTRNFSLR